MFHEDSDLAWEKEIIEDLYLGIFDRENGKALDIFTICNWWQ